MKTVIFGGTFNPPHLGHERVVELVGKELKPDRFLVIPTYIPPHKEIEAGSPTPGQRLALCKAAFEKYPFVTVSDLELKKRDVSYTVNTLAILKERYPEDEFYLVIGSDSFLNFTSWFCFEEIMKEATLVVISREKNDFESLSRKAEEYRRLYSAKALLIEAEPFVLSSSEIRAGKMDESSLSGEVLAYIRKKHLYA